MKNSKRTFPQCRHLIVTILFLPYALTAQESQNQMNTASPDVKESVTYELGNHLLTVQKVTENTIPILLYHPTGEATPSQPSFILTEAESMLLRKCRTLSFGGTVYHLASGPNRSLMNHYSGGENLPVVFWSSIDWNLLTVGRLSTSVGGTYSLMLMLSPVDIPKMHQIYAAHGGTYEAPSIPSFPAGPSTFSIVSGNPSPQLLAELNEIHEIHDREYDYLLAAWQKRETERKASESVDQLPIPPPADIVIQYREMTPEELKNR